MRQDFWHGLFLTASWIEVKVHSLTLFAFRHVKYIKTVRGDEFVGSRHKFRRSRASLR